MNYKIPLSVYVIWHPNFIHGQKISEFIYSLLCRDPEKPLIRSLGIPVYFRSVCEKDKKWPREIHFNESEYSAIIPLICDDFILNEEYREYIESVYDQCLVENNKRKIYPIALTKSAYNFSNKFSAINFIRTESKSDEGINLAIENQIRTPILHELCRLLMNMKKAVEEVEKLKINPPIKLFISHSKHDDSKSDAIKFRDFINSQTQLKTFFDANDIAYGSNFGSEIKKAASESALVVFQSDSYSDREWCRIEVIEAKSSGCPIVIVNAIQNGEKRAFPYLGNYPSIRLKNNFLEIVDLTLEQVLFNLFTKRLLDSLTDLYKIKAGRILSTSPELFNFIQLKKIGKSDDEEFAIVLYPDPPLGSEEIDLLNQLDDDFAFITPLTLPSLTLNNGSK